MEITVSLPGGRRVDAQVGAFTVRTDQPASAGGEGSAPAPFELFLASLATCAGLYVEAFCRARQIPTADIRLVQRHEGDLFRIDVQVPPSFPEAWRDGVARAAASCKVKKVIAAGPRFEVSTSVVPAPERRAA